MKRSNTLFYLLLWIMLALLVIFISKNRLEQKVNTPSETTPTVQTTAKKNTTLKKDKMIGIWIPYMALQTQEGTEAAFKSNYTKMVKSAKEFGVNTLFVHVRPFGDALYKSEFFPWSHIISGKQGVDPGFDPLEFMIEETHKNNMEFHAWINPLRVRTTKTPELLSEDNPYNTLNEENPYYFLNISNSIYFNPAYREVRSLIADGAEEIAKNYDVDGIQFDDYFYPEEMGDADSISYENYCENTENPLEVDKWRAANINSMVSQVYRQIKRANSKVVFGISPQGNLANNQGIYADVASWCKTAGYIDYICPQLYFSLENPALSFGQALESWKSIEKHEKLSVYYGLALYKAGTNEDEGTWLDKENIIAKQIEILKADEINGIVFYDIKCLNKEEAKMEIVNAKKELIGYKLSK